MKMETCGLPAMVVEFINLMVQNLRFSIKKTDCQKIEPANYYLTKTKFLQVLN